LFVSNAHAGASNGTVSAFSDGPFGGLTSIGVSPFADQQTAPCWVTISADGRYLYADNTASASISRFVINWDGTLSLLGSTPLSNPASAKPTEVRLDARGRYLYVLEGGVDGVGAFVVNDGTVSELSQSPFALPAGATPAGLAVTGFGGF
jgi:6-phosphogluconolactonase (cycloisomerase 2 family)